MSITIFISAVIYQNFAPTILYLVMVVVLSMMLTLSLLMVLKLLDLAVF